MIQLPGYEITERVHESQRTHVYRGLRESDGASIVIKIPAYHNPSLLDQKRFRREFQLGSQLAEMDHVIDYYALEPFSGGLALIEEDFGAISLERYLPEGGMPVPEFLNLAIQMARGLSQIHKHDIVHKDIKPANVVVNPTTGKLKIIDFGISSRLKREYQAAETPEALEGTLAYLSPEQTGRMNRALDYRTDFYSLGVSFYRLLCGKTPFTGEDALELIHCHMAREPVPPHEVRPGLPPVLSRIVGKLMAKDPESRYQSGNGIIADLERLRQLIGSSDMPIDFEPGLEDINEKFTISQKLYGRTGELEAIDEYFGAVCKGEMRTLMVTGNGGIGKSSLIRELQKPATKAQAFFLSGKFDRLSRDVAYSALSEAFRALIRRILSEHDQVVQVWREKLLQAMGGNGRILCDVLTDLELLVGKLPPVEDVGPQETRNRFFQVFKSCMEVLATQRHPLVLFLDDLQWADPASLGLLERLISDGQLQYFFLLGAYRDNEVDEHHLLEITLKNLARRERVVPILRLGALNIDHLADLIRDSLNCEYDRATTLAGVVFAKTNGNPFFCCEWLKSLHHHGLLNFDHLSGTWCWDIVKISELDVAVNVVDFLIESMRELPEETLATLRTAACMGMTFSLRDITDLRKLSQAEVARQLWPALRWGLVVPLSNNYRLMDSDWGEEMPGEIEICYRFQHDRVQQAAYALLPSDEAAALHLRLGRSLYERLDHGATDVMEVLKHLNRARHLIRDRGERYRLARLNLIAAQQALGAVAYRQTLNYLQVALAQLDADAWNADYQLAFEIHYLRAQATYYVGEASEAEALCRELIGRARSEVEKVRIFEIRIAQATTRGNMRQAIEAGLEGLALISFPIRARPNRFHVLAQLLQVKKLLRQTDLDQFHRGEEIRDEHVRAALDLLMRISLPAYMLGWRNLFALVALTRAKLCLEHGCCPEAANAFATLAAMFMHHLGDFSSGEVFGRLAMRLDERFNQLPLRPKLMFIYGLTIHGWSHHWKTITPFLDEAVETGHRSGDFMLAAMAAAQVSQWDPTLDLETACEEGRKSLALVKEMGYKNMEMQARVFQQVRRNLMGLTRDRLSLSDVSFDESKLRFTSLEGTTFAGVYAVSKMMLAYLHGAFDEATEYEARVKGNELTIVGLPLSVEYCFYAFLLAAVRLHKGEGDWHCRAVLWRNYRTMKRWAAHCPVNFEHRRLLMLAELMALLHRESKALDYYQAAMDQAREQGYRAHEALAAELAGVYLLRRQRPKLAGTYLREAVELYGRWGAMAKVRQLRSIYQFLLPKSVDSTKKDDDTATHMSMTSMSASHTTPLDLASVIKSSLAISGEIEYRSLISKMMDIIMESAGARKGGLVRMMQGTLRVEAISMLDLPHHGVMRAEPLDQCRDISHRVVRYTIRTGNVVELPNAIADHNFSRDPYIQEHQVKSILCLPIRHKDLVNGVLYLENNLTEGAFTTDRINLLQLLIAQAAISLENSRLLADTRKSEAEVRKLNRELENLNKTLEQKVAERTEELKDVQAELLDKAHQAGMAEIATSVLHNVGNILNSVITSCQLVHATAENSRLSGLLKANEMLRQNMDNLEDFLLNNPKGLNLMKYYIGLDKPFLKEREVLLENTSRLIEKVESIRTVIMAQQSYASKGFQSEQLAIGDIVDDALNMLSSSINRHQVRVEKHIATIPTLFLPRAKLIHLFVNLIKNAVEAMDELPPQERVLNITMFVEDERLKMLFKDTGHGIQRENLEQIFQHGFTTKKRGHGFGLHSVANNMTEMGGSIEVHSDGIGKGAVFTLSFPLEPDEN